MPSPKPHFQIRHIQDRGRYEFLSSKTRLLCESLVDLADKQSYRMKQECEKTRIKKIRDEIRLIEHHKMHCKNPEIIKRMKKTIHYLQQKIENPEAVYE